MLRGMSATRRTWWLLALGLTWPAWAVTRSVVHLRFEADIGNALAAATAITFVFTLRTVPVPDLRDWRRKRHILELQADVAALQARLSAQEERAAAYDTWMSGNAEALRRGLAAAGVEVPDAIAAGAITQPIFLRDRRRVI